MRILFTGGGTGGHFFPIVAIIRELRQIAEEERILDVELFYMGPDDFGEGALRDERVRIIRVRSGKLRRYFSLRNAFDVFRTIAAIFYGVWRMFFVMPDVVFSKGGYGALPAVIGSIIFRIPLIIHESDATPGKVNTFSARFAKRIGIAFVGAEDLFPAEKTAFVGVPIRKRILGGNKQEAKEHFGIFSSLSVAGIIGASQGSQKINDTLLPILKDLTEEYEIVHQTGRENYDAVSGEAKVVLESGHQGRYHPAGFLNEVGLRDFYMVSDIIVSRAGASSIYEIAAWGKPLLLIPLGHAAQDHQRKNAYEYAGGGAAVVIEEENLTPHILLAEIKKLADNPERMKKMGEAAQRFSRIDSAEVVAREILKLGLHENT